MLLLKYLLIFCDYFQFWPQCSYSMGSFWTATLPKQINNKWYEKHSFKWIIKSKWGKPKRHKKTRKLVVWCVFFYGGIERAKCHDARLLLELRGNMRPCPTSNTQIATDMDIYISEIMSTLWNNLYANSYLQSEYYKAKTNGNVKCGNGIKVRGEIRKLQFQFDLIWLWFHSDYQQKIKFS